MSDFKLVKLLDALNINIDADGLLHKYDATAAPTATDDTNAGYSVGSHWIDVTNDDAYICVDASAGAAIWDGPLGVAGSDELIKVSANDTTAGYLNGKLVAGTGITLTENNDGSNETLTIDATGGGGSGAGANLQSAFDTTLAASDPGSGNFRLNSATPASVTNVYINDTTDNGADIGSFVDKLVSGDIIYIQQSSDATKFLALQVSSVTDNTGWYTIAVSVLDSSTLFGNTEECAFGFGYPQQSLTASRALQSSASGVIEASSVTSTELSYVSGVTSAIQTQINNKQDLDATLTALAAYNTNGLLTQTAADTFTGRTITAGSGIGVTNGDGVSGNPAVALDIDGLTADTAIGATDTIPIYDGANKKITFANFEGALTVDNMLTNFTDGSVIFSDGTNLAEANSKLFFDSTNGRLGVGNVGATETTVTFNGTTYGSTFSVHAEGATDIVQTSFHRHTNIAGLGAYTTFLRSRGTEGAETVVQDNDNIGRIYAYGFDGTDYEVAAAISFNVDETTPSDTAMGGEIIFSTTARGTDSLSPAMTINADQLVTFNNHPAGLVTTSVDETVPRFDGTTGILQTSGMTIDDSNNVNGIENIGVVSISFDGDISSAAWGMAGIRVTGPGTSTFTDTTSSGTVAQATTVVLSQGTIAASSATTYTNYYGAYAYEQVAGTNVTFTDGWALGADSLRIGAFGGSNFVTITNDGTFRASALDPFAGNWFKGKGYVHVASTANVDIATGLENGDTIDGYTLVTGNRVLLRHQTDATENGIYIVPASGAASRAADANTWSEVENILVSPENGTANAGKVYRTYDNKVGYGVLGTDDLIFEEYAGPDRISINIDGTTEVANDQNGFAASSKTRPGGILNVQGTATYQDPSATRTNIQANPMVNYEGITRTEGSNGWNTLGAGFLFWAHGSHQAAGAGTGPFYTLVGQMSIESDNTSPVVQAFNTDILLNTNVEATGSSTYTITSYNAIDIAATVTGANTTVGTLRNILVKDGNEESSGTITNQLGICVQNLTTATNKTLLQLGSETADTGNFCINQKSNTYVNKWNAGHRLKKRAPTGTSVTITTADHIVECSNTGTVTATLPDATACEGLHLIIKKTGTPGTVNVTSVSSQTFDGAASPLALSTQYHLASIYSDGSNWKVLHTGAP